MHSILDMGRRRVVQSANFNGHRPGEKHPDRVMGVHDILCVTEGGWELCQDGERHILGKGDVIFLHAGRHHWGGAHAPGVRTMYVHIESLPGDAWAPGNPGPAQPADRLAVPAVVRAHEPATLIPLIEDIIFTFWSDAPNKHVKLSALVDLLLFQMAESGRAMAPTYDRMVEYALYHIRMTPDRVLPLSELADRLHVCTKNLTNRFRAATGKTVHQYQLDLKLDMACMLIRDNPARPFKDIAQAMGFYDEFHFSRLFKRRYGHSPVELKRAARQGKA